MEKLQKAIEIVKIAIDHDINGNINESVKLYQKSILLLEETIQGFKKKRRN